MRAKTGLAILGVAIALVLVAMVPGRRGAYGHFVGGEANHFLVVLPKNTTYVSIFGFCSFVSEISPQNVMLKGKGDCLGKPNLILTMKGGWRPQIYLSPWFFHRPVEFKLQGEINQHFKQMTPRFSETIHQVANSAVQDKLEIVVVNDYDPSVYSKANIFKMNETNKEALAQSLVGFSEKQKINYKTGSDIFNSPKGGLIVDVLNVVAGLWKFGNDNKKHFPGCVQVNELIKSDQVYRTYEDGSASYWQNAATIADYLKSPYGCCTDHAFVAKAAFDGIGLLSARYDTPTHWVNEIELAGRKFTLDVTAGIVVDKGFTELLTGVKRKAWLFINKNLLLEKNKAANLFTLTLGLIGGHTFSEKQYTRYESYRNMKPQLNNEFEQVGAE